MGFLFGKAYFGLVRLERDLAQRNFAALHDRVRRTPVRAGTVPADAMIRVCSAVDHACIWYWKQVQCLQRSAVTTCLLRRYGIPAQLVIGAKQMPFRAHAWVEVDGRVVNDKPDRVAMYSVLERC